MSSKILYLESSFPINTRSQKIINSLSEYDVHVCTWDRLGTSPNKINNYHIYISSNTGYGNKFKKFISIFNYTLFFIKVLKTVKPKIIICSHWDMLFISSLFKKNCILIYDNLDIPEFKIKVIEKIIIYLEKFFLKNVEISFLASRFYLPIYKNYNCVVLENLPTVVEYKTKSTPLSLDDIKIGFVGSVRHLELLKNLILAIQELPNLNLEIYGSGIVLDELISFYKTNNFKNVNFHGKFNYNEIQDIYKKIDILWAAYPFKSRNVKYAISNKYYESILFSIPCIFSSNTMLGKHVADKKIGVTVDPYSIINIKQCIIELVNNYNEICSNLINYKSSQNINWKLNDNNIKKIIRNYISND